MPKKTKKIIFYVGGIVIFVIVICLLALKPKSNKQSPSKPTIPLIEPTTNETFSDENIPTKREDINLQLTLEQRKRGLKISPVEEQKIIESLASQVNDEFGGISDKDKKYVDLLDEAEKEKHLLKENDIIMARIGSVGETGIFQGKEKSIFASYLIRINLSKEMILPKYYWYFAKTEEYWKQVEQLTKGTIQPQFNANSLKEIVIPFPRLEKQRETIEEREKYLMIINYQKRSIELLKEKQRKFLNNLW